MKRNIFAEKGFIHLLGPNPAIVPGGGKAWDGSVLEACDIFKEKNAYYWYYHAIGKDENLWPKGYRIGVATAPFPLGPWTKYEKNPILDHGPEGSWEDHWVACGCVMKEGAYNIRGGTEKYCMWYSGGGTKSKGYSIGLATASSPLGPWEKYEGNPIIEDFGYVCNVIKVNGRFHMYSEHPVGVTDHGPYCLATADNPEGPWTRYEGNPVLTPGDWGAWDSTGYSEAKVVYHEGVFHTFYSACEKQKIESIGYAYSFDGHNFIKYGANPVVPLQKTPNASAYAEVQTLIEPPFVYLYHTLRYYEDHERRRGAEDLGIQVLSITPYFKLAMPILSINSLRPSKVSRLESCCPVSLESASSLALTSECTYDADATAGLRVHVTPSHDGIDYDNVDLYNFDTDFEAGKAVKKTVELSPKAKFVKVIVENLDSSHDVTSVNVTATLGN